MIGVYKITCLKTDKVYIGESINIEERWKEHKCPSSKGCYKLYNSLNKYGVENHTFEVIEECGWEQNWERELYWINFYNSVENGLNIRYGIGRHSKLSEETKQKISQIRKNKRENTPKEYKVFTEKIKESLKEYYKENPSNRNAVNFEKIKEIKDFNIKNPNISMSEIKRLFNVRSSDTIIDIVKERGAYTKDKVKLMEKNVI